MLWITPQYTLFTLSISTEGQVDLKCQKSDLYELQVSQCLQAREGLFEGRVDL